MRALYCPRCLRPFPPDVLHSGVEFVCPGCARPMVVDVYPAASRGTAAPVVVAAGEGTATCFFHDERSAQAACDSCGRYLCALCDISLGDQHLCPECLEAQQRDRARQSMPGERRIWDRGALGIAILSWPLALFTMGLAGLGALVVVLFLMVRYGRQPASLVDRAWPRFALALMVALVPFLFFVGMVTAIAVGLSRG